MRNSDADIAIDVLNKLIAQELEAASAGMRFGNRPLEESASIRYHAYINARDKIRERSPMPWRSGMLGTRSSVSVMSWSRRICTLAICVAGGCPVRSMPCILPIWIRRRPLRRCVPTACGG